MSSNSSKPSLPELENAESDPENWVDFHGDALFRYAKTKTNDRELAEEWVQETFVAAIKNRKNFENRSTVLTWLSAILRRKIADHYRRENRRMVGTLDETNLQDDASMARARRSDWADDPQRILMNREFWDLFEMCIDELPDKLAEVYILRDVNQRSPKEICEILGISATNLSMRLFRYRVAVRECLNKKWYDQG